MSKFQNFGAYTHVLSFWHPRKTHIPPKFSFQVGFQGKESPKTIKNRLNFPFINNKMLNNSFFPPWVDLKTHIPGILMLIRFFWHMSLEWASKFLLWSLMDGVHNVKIEGLWQKKLYNGFYDKYLHSHVWRDDFRHFWNLLPGDFKEIQP